MGKSMTGYKSKREAALDEEGMYLVHHTKRKDDEDDDIQVYQRTWVDLTENEIEVIEVMALTKAWAIRMTMAQLKERNT
jgi:hypothetical protein